MPQVTIEQASQRLPDLLKASLAGEDVVIFENDRAIARLVPVEPATGQPRFGSAKGKIQMADDFDAPLDDFREYME